MTPWAAKWSACWDEPHCRSTVVAGTDSGQPAASTALRPMLIGLVTDLHDTAHDHVVDDGRVEVVALDERLQRLGGEVGRVPAGQLAVPLPTWRADGIDDHCVRHRGLLGPFSRGAVRLWMTQLTCSVK